MLKLRRKVTSNKVSKENPTLGFSFSRYGIKSVKFYKKRKRNSMTDTKQKEVWRPYPDYPFVEASNLGIVRTKDHYIRDKNGVKRLIKGHVLKQYLLSNGYMQVYFGLNGKLIALLVHRIVAVSHLPNPHGYPEVNHKDNDRTNNVVSNLEWCTSQYNSDYRKNFGASSAELFGRPVIAIKPESSEVLWFESRCEAARQLGIYPQNISAIINGKQNKAHGYSFINVDENMIERVRSKCGDEVAEKVEKLIMDNCN